MCQVPFQVIYLHQLIMIESVWIGAEAWIVYKVYWVILLCLHDRKLLTYKIPMILAVIL